MSEEYKKLVEILDDQGVLQSDQPWAEPIIKFVKANKNRKARTKLASTGGEAVAKVSVWQVDPWYASDPSKAGRNIGVEFLLDYAKTLLDGQLLYTHQQLDPAGLVVDRELLANFIEYSDVHKDGVREQWEFDKAALVALLNQAGGDKP